MAKRTVTVEQFDYLSADHRDVRRIMDDRKTDFHERQASREKLQAETGYRVHSAQNTTEPRLGQWLREHEVESLIAQGFTVNIRQPKVAS